MSYHHLTIEERSCIYQFLKLGMSIREISAALKRSPSTISRELKRNKKKYFPNIANKQYLERRKSCRKKSKFDQESKDYVQSKLIEHWSPEQIAHRICKQIKTMPSTSTIYRMIHNNILSKVSMKNLRRKGQFKRPAETRGKFNDRGRSIRKRDKAVHSRKELGHWEADTVESGRFDGKRKSLYCFVTLAERKSRYYIAILVPNRTEKIVTPAIVNALRNFPEDFVKTITFDRGKEFSGYLEIEKQLNCNTYFCDPYCAWQKGTNENTNGLLREFYPKGMDLSFVREIELKSILFNLNSRPRKCLNYATPHEELFNTYT